MPGMVPRAQLKTATWTIQDQTQATTWAVKVIRGCRGVVSSGWSSDNDLDDSSLTHRDLEVVTELHILDKVQSLSHGDVAEGLEEHHGDWSSRKHVTNHKLGEHVEPKLRVGGALDHADGDEEDNGEQERDDERPPRQMRVPDQDRNEGQGKQESK